jgi:endonuclease YncB( thermonuclease family)
MKQLLNSSSLLIGLTLVLIGVLSNRQTINNGIQKGISHLFFKNNYAQQWQIKPNSIHDGDTLRVVRGNEELKVRLCGIDAPELKMPLGIESRDYLRSEAMP